MKKISYRYLLENTLSPSKMKSKNSMKNISYTTIYKFQHELDKSDLLPGFPCCSQSCRKRLSKRIPLPQVFTSAPPAFEGTELPVPELPLEAPADCPACPGQPVLHCAHKVLWEDLLAACTRPLSFEIICR